MGCKGSRVQISAPRPILTSEPESVCVRVCVRFQIWVDSLAPRLRSRRFIPVADGTRLSSTRCVTYAHSIADSLSRGRAISLPGRSDRLRPHGAADPIVDRRGPRYEGYPLAAGGLGEVRAQHLAIPDQARGELRAAAAFAPQAPQDPFPIFSLASTATAAQDRDGCAHGTALVRRRAHNSWKTPNTVRLVTAAASASAAESSQPQPSETRRLRPGTNSCMQRR
jgi:hypothetical protein